MTVKNPSSLTVGLKFLNNFTKAAALSGEVEIQMQDDLPLLVDYSLGDLGNLRFYLAPKGDDEDS